MRSSLVDKNAGYEEYRIIGYAGGRVVVLIVAVVATGGILVAAGLLAAGEISATTAAAMVVAMILLSGMMTLRIRQLGQGFVRLWPDRLEVSSWGKKETYNWPHIADVRIADSPSRLGKSLNDPSPLPVMIALTRGRREGLLPWQAGTDVVGVPAPWAKKITVTVDDPAGLVGAAQALISGAE